MADTRTNGKRLPSRASRGKRQVQRVPYFLKNQNALHLFDDVGSSRLRPPQLALARACLAHFTRSDLPAIGALPTGVGKTGTIATLPYLLPAKRVLVAVPNRLLREQVASELREMALFRRLGLLTGAVPNPTVAVIDHQIRDEKAWADYESADIVVATPYCISPAIKGVVAPPP